MGITQALLSVFKYQLDQSNVENIVFNLLQRLNVAELLPSIHKVFQRIQQKNKLKDIFSKLKISNVIRTQETRLVRSFSADVLVALETLLDSHTSQACHVTHCT